MRTGKTPKVKIRKVADLHYLSKGKIAYAGASVSRGEKMPRGMFGGFWQIAWNTIGKYFGTIGGGGIGPTKGWSVDDYRKGAMFLLEQKKKYLGTIKGGERVRNNERIKRDFGAAVPGDEFPQYVKDLVNLDTNDDGFADLFISIGDDTTPADFLPEVNFDPSCSLAPKIDVDTNQDGFEDINIDTDGDGVAEMNLDFDGDGMPDANIDTDGDGEPDTNIIPVPNDEPPYEYMFFSIKFKANGHIILDQEVLILEKCKIEIDAEENYLKIYPKDGESVDPEYYIAQLDLLYLVTEDSTGADVQYLLKVLDSTGNPLPSSTIIRNFISHTNFVQWAKYWEGVIGDGSIPTLKRAMYKTFTSSQANQTIKTLMGLEYDGNGIISVYATNQTVSFTGINPGVSASYSVGTTRQCAFMSFVETQDRLTIGANATIVYMPLSTFMLPPTRRMVELTEKVEMDENEKDKKVKKINKKTIC